MKKTYYMQIDGKNFEVVIEDLDARPIKAIVNGQEILVTPTDAMIKQPTLAVDKNAALPVDISFSTDKVLSPLPGKIIDVFVKNGDIVEKGQVILIIEAMKMKNSIRATRGGKVKIVHVHGGDNVAHKHLLLEFAE